MGYMRKSYTYLRIRELVFVEVNAPDVDHCDSVLGNEVAIVDLVFSAQVRNALWEGVAVSQSLPGVDAR